MIYKIKYAAHLIKVLWAERNNAGCRAKWKRIDRKMHAFEAAHKSNQAIDPAKPTAVCPLWQPLPIKKRGC